MFDSFLVGIYNVIALTLSFVSVNCLWSKHYLVVDQLVIGDVHHHYFDYCQQLH